MPSELTATGGFQGVRKRMEVGWRSETELMLQKERVDNLAG